MTKPYSTDLRVRVVEAVDEGATRQEAAERLGVSVSSAVRWHQVWRHEGTIEAKPYGGSRSPLDDRAEEILAVIEEQPDLTLDEIVAVMRNRRTAILGASSPEQFPPHPTRYAATAFSSNFSPRPGLVGSTNCPFSIAGVSS